MSVRVKEFSGEKAAPGFPMDFEISVVGLDDGAGSATQEHHNSGADSNATKQRFMPAKYLWNAHQNR
jgi:hypothetical protein